MALLGHISLKPVKGWNNDRVFFLCFCKLLDPIDALTTSTISELTAEALSFTTSNLS